VLAVVLAVSGLHLLRRHRPGWSGALLGAAVAVKLYPILLFPAALRRRPAAVAGAAAFVVAASYVPHVLVVGPRVLGYLPGYLHEEHYASGGRFLLLSGLGVPTWAAGILAAAGLAAVALVVVRGPGAAAAGTGSGVAGGRGFPADQPGAALVRRTPGRARAASGSPGVDGGRGAFVLVTGLLRSARRGGRFANRKTAAAP